MNENLFIKRRLKTLAHKLTKIICNPNFLLSLDIWIVALTVIDERLGSHPASSQHTLLLQQTAKLLQQLNRGFINLSIYLFIDLSIYLSIYLYIYIYLIYLSIYMPIYLIITSP